MYFGRMRSVFINLILEEIAGGDTDSSADAVFIRAQSIHGEGMPGSDIAAFDIVDMNITADYGRSNGSAIDYYSSGGGKAASIDIAFGNDVFIRREVAAVDTAVDI